MKRPDRGPEGAERVAQVVKDDRVVPLAQVPEPRRFERRVEADAQPGVVQEGAGRRREDEIAGLGEPLASRESVERDDRLFDQREPACIFEGIGCRTLARARMSNSETQPDREPGRFRAFWTSLPGILTGVAGLVAAVAGLLALFVVPGDSGGDGPTRAEWADSVDPICSQAMDTIRGLPLTTTTDPAALLTALPQLAQTARSMAERVRAIDAPEEDQQTIDRMTGTWDQQADAADAAVSAYQSGDPAGFQAAGQEITTAADEGDALAQSLGVTACAQSPTPTG